MIAKTAVRLSASLELSTRYDTADIALDIGMKYGTKSSHYKARRMCCFVVQKQLAYVRVELLSFTATASISDV